MLWAYFSPNNKAFKAEITIKLSQITIIKKKYKREISFQDKFEILPIDQNVNFCNFSAEVK